ALVDGRLDSLDGTPFVLITATGHPPVAGSPSIRRRIERRLAPGPAESLADAPAELEARCLLRSGEARDHLGRHRALGREQVRSEYESGSRREPNPAYDAAKARLKQAERDAKPQKSSIIKVGDPLVDLVGMLVGGAITGVSQWGSGDQVEEAIDALVTTPRSIDQPVYRPYQFERARVRASRAATIPITLTDRRLGKTWNTALRRREVREFAVLDGLDRRDRDYAAHQATSLSEKGLRQWEAEWPLPELEEMVAGLLDRSRPSNAAPVNATRDETDGFAAVHPGGIVDDGGMIDGGFIETIDSVDAAILPASLEQPSVFEAEQRLGGTPVAPVPPSRIRGDLVVEVHDQDRRGQGVYVRPGFVLASSDLVGDRGLIDVDDPEGGVVLGLVAGIDRNRGLALIQMPGSDHPIARLAGDIGDPASTRGQSVRGAAVDADFSQPAVFAGGPAQKSPGKGDSFPLLEDGFLIGFKNRNGLDVPIGDIRAFLRDQELVLRNY
ncbi:MAG: hypothetical protein ACR2Q4_15195, partial [Geminicoccaceae bacterium]